MSRHRRQQRKRMRRSWDLRPITKEQQERFARIIASCYQPPEPFTADQYVFRQAAEPEFERQFFPMVPPNPMVTYSKPASLECEPPLVLEFESPEAVERFIREAPTLATREAVEHE